VYAPLIDPQHALCAANNPLHPESETENLRGTAVHGTHGLNTLSILSEPTELLGGVDSLGGSSPQWQHPSSITNSPTMNRQGNQRRIAAIRHRSIPLCHMCQHPLRFA
jgi:hypothetical protein